MNDTNTSDFGQIFQKLLTNLLNQEDSKLFLLELCKSENNQLLFNIPFERSSCNKTLLFILSRITHTASPKHVFSILNLRNEAGFTFGMLLAQHQSQDVCLGYIELLIQLYRKGISAEALIAHLSLQSLTGLNHLLLLAKRQFWQNITYISDFLQLLLQENTDVQQDLYRLMQTQVNLQATKQGILEILIENNQVNVVFKLLRQGLLPTSCYPKLFPIKTRLIEHILSIENRFIKKNILRDCFDKALPLGNFFSCFYTFSLRQLRQTLLQLEHEDKQRWWHTLFPQAKSTEIEQYLYLIDPKQPQLKI